MGDFIGNFGMDSALICGCPEPLEMGMVRTYLLGTVQHVTGLVSDADVPLPPAQESTGLFTDSPFLGVGSNCSFRTSPKGLSGKLPGLIRAL